MENLGLILGIVAVLIVLLVGVWYWRRSVNNAPIEVTRPHGKIASLGSRLAQLFRNRDGIDWDALEEILLAADVGVAASGHVVERTKTLLRDSKSELDPTSALAHALTEIFSPTASRDLTLSPVDSGALEAILMVGVNGVGKTTSVGKIAAQLKRSGYGVVLGAADTFRAAAADQLQTWGDRVGAAVIRGADQMDPAAVAFQAVTHAREIGAQVVMIDTAGRLHNKRDLMDQLGKIRRVVEKTAPVVEVLLVLDATTGQNGMNQARTFAAAVDVTGVVLTKLDGSAKGGIVVAVERELGIPVKYVGLGEDVNDLVPFEPKQFVADLLGQ